MYATAKVRRSGYRVPRLQLWQHLFGSIHDQGCCYWCEKPMTFEESTFDHVPALSRPNSHPFKGVISCYDCNNKNGSKRHPSLEIPDYFGIIKAENRKREKNDTKYIEKLWEQYFGAQLWAR